MSQAALVPVTALAQCAGLGQRRDDGRVLVRDVTTRAEVAQLGRSVTALAKGPPGPSESSLVVAHRGAGFSLWSVIGAPQE